MKKVNVISLKVNLPRHIRDKFTYINYIEITKKFFFKLPLDIQKNFFKKIAYCKTPQDVIRACSNYVNIALGINWYKHLDKGRGKLIYDSDDHIIILIKDMVTLNHYLSGYQIWCIQNDAYRWPMGIYMVFYKNESFTTQNCLHGINVNYNDTGAYIRNNHNFSNEMVNSSDYINNIVIKHYLADKFEVSKDNINEIDNKILLNDSNGFNKNKDFITRKKATQIID